MAKPSSFSFWAILVLAAAALAGFVLAFAATKTLVATREQLQRTQSAYATERLQTARMVPVVQDDGELLRLRNENAQLRAQMRAMETMRMGGGRQFGQGPNRIFAGGRRGESPEAPPRNKEDEIRFMEQNKTNAGVVVLPSGLQYKVITGGFGRAPRSNELVTINYRGVLTDGTEVDSSRGDSTEVAVNGVMEGWREALLRMPVGAKWQVFIPAELAYGDRGSTRRIPANATLIYELELLSIRDRATSGLPPAFISGRQEEQIFETFREP